MTQLDLKKLSKGMHIKDKMRLLFEDINLQSETSGKESVLTPQERKSIIEDARRTGEIKEISRVHELYKTAMFVTIDVEIAYLRLCLTITQLEKTLIGIISKDSAEDIISEIIYDLARQDYQVANEIENKTQELRQKYRVDKIIFQNFDFFIPSADGQTLEPNHTIQTTFMLAFHYAKRLKQKLYELSYVQQKAPIDFLPTSTKDLTKNAEELLQVFSTLDESLKTLRVYRDYGSIFAQGAALVEPKFLEVIQEIDKQIELSEADKNNLGEKIDKTISENLY